MGEEGLGRDGRPPTNYRILGWDVRKVFKHRRSSLPSPLLSLEMFQTVNGMMSRHPRG
jgi:hypothetical protein